MILPYEQEIIERTKKQSFFLIGGMGIDLTLVIKYTVLLYCNKYSLVFLINFSDTDLMYNHKYFRFIKDMDKKNRKALYMKGGVFVCTDRVLLIDFLEDNISVEKVSCLIIKDADKIKENSLNAFILYIYRQKNTKGHIKAFSTNCTPIACGIGSLERYISTLCTNNMILYPRFHKSIEKSFVSHVQFVQHRFKLPDAILELQMILVEILKEILSTNKVDTDYELVLISNAYMSKYVRDVYDIKYLMKLLFSCNMQKVCMECMRLINEQIELGNNSTWINCRYTIILIEKIEKLILGYNDLPSTTLDKSHDYFAARKKFRVEKFAKPAEDEKMQDDKYNLKYLKLIDLLNNDAKQTYIVFESAVTKFDIENNLQNFKPKMINSVVFIVKKDFLDTEIVDDNIILRQKFSALNNFIDESSKIDEVYTYVEKINEQDEIRCSTETLVILYDLDIALVRKCEYIGTKTPLKVISFIYKDSLEEQKYLNSVRREKYNFELLIEKRRSVGVELCRTDYVLEDEDSDEEQRTYKVIVDSRELRAELPFFLYKYKNEVTIDTLSMGDYLINEDICVERKSISDLISSLSSGRLYQQARVMSYNYKTPLLLIEFSNRPCLSDHYNHSADTFKNSLVSKLCLFLMSFPSMRLMWSESCLYSTKLFRCLQKKETYENEMDTQPKIDPVLQEILLSLPGINQFNMRRIVKNFCNLKEIIETSLEDLQVKLGDECGYKIYTFFNSKFTSNDE